MSLSFYTKTKISGTVLDLKTKNVKIFYSLNSKYLLMVEKIRKAKSLIIPFLLIALVNFLIFTTSCSDGSKSQYGQTVIIGMKGDFDSFNEVMERLYDWGDINLTDEWPPKKVCWIKTF